MTRQYRGKNTGKRKAEKEASLNIDRFINLAHAFNTTNRNNNKEIPFESLVKSAFQAHLTNATEITNTFNINWIKAKKSKPTGTTQENKGFFIETMLERAKNAL